MGDQLDGRFLAAGPPGGPPVSLTDVLVILFAASVVSMAAPTLAVVAATRAVRDEPGAHTVRTTAWIVFGISIGGLGPLGRIVWGPVLYLGLRHGKTRSSA